MINKKYFFFIFSFLFILTVNAQNEKDSLVIGFNLKWKNEPLKLNTIYHSKTDSLQITTLKFYVSGISIQFDDNSKFIENNYHLIDIEEATSLNFSICKKTNKMVTKIAFNIGVDSLASVAGALSGDLDPTKGMYWAWQSGYINMKIEGTSSSCKTRKNQFQFHIGGYMKPNYAMRKVEIIVNKKDNITIAIAVNDFFSNIKLSQINSVMIPGKLAMEIATSSVKMFRLE